MAWDSIDDLWWLKPKPEQSSFLDNVKTFSTINSENARTKVMEAQQADYHMRTAIDLNEFLSKQRLQTKIAAGQGKLASVMAGIDDWSDPKQMQQVWQVGVENPELVGSPVWKGVETMHNNAMMMQVRKDEVQRKVEADKARAEARFQQLDINQQKADAYGLSIDDKRDAQEAIKLYREGKLEQADRMATIAEGKLKVAQENAASLAEFRKAKAVQFERGLAPGEATIFSRRFQAIQDRQMYGTKAERLSPEAHQKALDDLFQEFEPKLQRGVAAPGTTAPAQNPAQAAPAGQVPQSGKTAVIGPDGKSYLLPSEQLDKALKQGFKLLQ